MTKTKIAVISLGHSKNFFNKKKIRNWDSKYFEVNTILDIEEVPESEYRDSYLDQKYTTEQLEHYLMCPDGSDIALGIMAYRFVDNFYMHRIGEKFAVVSLYGIQEILMKDNISIENFIIKQLYEMAIFKNVYNNVTASEIENIIHSDTRGCMFDLNGDRHDIIYNTEKPKICDSCRSKLKKQPIEEKYIENIDKELLKIKKAKILSMELFIKKYPLFSVVISGLVAIILNILANYIWEAIKSFINR